LLKKRQRYVPDLQEMAALCEANYLRLLKLLTGAEVGEERVFQLSNDRHSARVRLCVDEDHRYTPMVSVTQEGLSPEWLQPLSMQVRLYHDASMAEVLSYQNQQRFDGRYTYPNPAMRMPDEKVQLNRFLAEWLDHCLKYGQTIQPIVLADRILPVR
jgi:uncharacterized protein YqiB (DUF1249 family)